MTTQAAANPNRNDLFGEMLDSDGHIYMLPEVQKELMPETCFGPTWDFLSGYVSHAEFGERRRNNRAQLWETKGLGALGAYDADERVEALDAMGIRTQLLFANNTLFDLRGLSERARAASVKYNDYAIDFSNRSKGRARAVCHINTSDIAFAIAETRRVVRAGARGVMLPCAQPPGGVSPSHESWDPMWAVLQEANVPALLHLGGAGLLSSDTPEDMMFPPPAWRDSATLRNKPAFRAGGEESISPYFMLVTHMAPELFLQTMVMGKVFERFPALRFGIIEFGAAWVGPCVERMDLWSNFMARVGVSYALKPSEFVRRNVRVTPFWHENLPQMVERYGLPEIYCFSTDYPHLEGSKDPIGKFERQLAKMPANYRRQFFIENNKWLLPDA